MIKSRIIPVALVTCFLVQIPLVANPIKQSKKKKNRTIYSVLAEDPIDWFGEDKDIRVWRQYEYEDGSPLTTEHLAYWDDDKYYFEMSDRNKDGLTDVMIYERGSRKAIKLYYSLRY